MSVEGEEDKDLTGMNVMKLETYRDAQRACEMLVSDPKVEYAHLIQERFLSPSAKRKVTRGNNQTLDPLISRQWGLVAVNLFQALKMPGFNTAKDIVVAIIDTGVDANHPDLDGIVTDEQNFTSGPLQDTKGHGTHVIGIIAAMRNNKIGISGVCQSQKIMSLKALGPYNGPGYYRAIRYAINNGAQVINLSLGGGHDQTEELLIRKAIKQGVIVVAAMGNEFKEGNPTSYPAAIDGVISVGASTEVDERASFSNTGPHINLMAPGTSILSTVPTYPVELADVLNYEAWPGTSMATPFVAATAALLLAKKPTATLKQVTQALVKGSDKVPGQTGFSKEFGHGRLNVKRALAGI